MSRVRIVKATDGRWLIGRTIRAVKFNLFPDGRGGTTGLPILTLDNGDRISFEVRETESGTYGVNIEVHTTRKQ